MTSKICVVLHTLRAAMPWNLVFSRRRRATQKKNENLKENAMDQDESTKVVKEHSEFEEGKKENAMNQDEGAKVVKGHSEFEEGQRFYWLDDYTKAEQLLQEAVSIQEKEFGTYNRRLLPTKYWLGRTLYAQGKFDAAEAVFRQVVDGRKSPLMPIKDHLDALGAEIWLGYSFYAQSKSGEEEKHVRRQSKSVRPPTVSVQSLAGYSLGEEAVRRIVADDGNSHDLGHGKFFRQLLIDDDESVRSLSFCEEPGIVPHIEFGAKHGCSNCQDVLQSLQYFRDIHFKQGTLLNLSLRAPLFHRDSILVAASYAEFSESSSDVVRKNLTYFIMPSLMLSSTLASRHQLTSIGSLLRPANKWLQDCTKKHPHCAVPDPTFIPRRLVSVGHRQSDPFLTEDQPVHCKYAALSYCWGSTEDTLMTKRHNLLQHFETIDTMALPKTIRDAIIVCRCLEIDYLWVDALCIVQDDVNEQDWYEQSKQMGSIYSNAYLVISADGASCCTDGFLPEEEDYSWEIVYRQPFSEGNEDAEVVRLAREVDASEHQRKPYNSRSLDIEALSQRGWSMQECILPHRILHFTEEELIWECSTDCACECGNTRIHNLWKHHDYNLINDPRIQHVDERPYFNVHIDDFLRGKSAESTCWIWERLMEQYSQRFLTLPGDKIAAISGLARLFQKSLGASPTDYIAGLWKTDLPICLLWHVTGSSTPSRPVEWRAPSWSWASVDGGVGFFNERYQFSFRPHVRIEECVSEPVSVDPFGKVRKAKIRIAGDLVPVTLEVRAESKSAYKGQFVGHSGKPPKAFEDLNVTVRADGESYEILPDVRLESDTYDTCVEGYYCLRIGNTYDSMKDIYSSIKDLYDLRNNVELPRAGERCWWLVLQRAVGASEDGNGDLFRRFGIGMFDSSSRTVDIFPTRPLYQTHVTLI